MSEELDKQCAALLGRPWRKPTHGSCQTCGWDFDNCQGGYSEDPEKALLLENEIERTALGPVYVEYLIAFADARREDWNVELVWSCLRAAPEVRARAFVATMPESFEHAGAVP